MRLQVEEPLWRQVAARAGVPLERDRPQRLVAAGLQGAACPTSTSCPSCAPSRSASDGMRHLFHRDDSHLNARGNAVVGAALGAFLRPLVPAR